MDFFKKNRHWRRYWPSYLLHWIQGAAVPVLMVSITPVWVGISLLVTFIAYQALEYHKRKDTVGVDMGDFLLGLMLGIVFAVLLLIYVQGIE